MAKPGKILIPLFGNDVAPRFDLATEVLIALSDGSPIVPGEEKIVVLPQASAEQLCHLILTEKIQVVICGGIEEEYYQYLTWKQVDVYDSVVGSWEDVLACYGRGRLKSGAVLGAETD